MNIKLTFFLILSILILSISSCKNDDDNQVQPSKSINDFVWKSMNLWYYWQAQVPNLADDKFQNDTQYTTFLNAHETIDLFQNLLFDYGNTDRFSWIVTDYHELENSFAGTNLSFGMDYGLVYESSNSSNIFGYVQYVLPNSPASMAGLHRGDIFTQINGIQLNNSNYNELLSQNTAIFGMGYLQEGQVHDGDSQIQLSKVQLQENPIYLSESYVINGHRIGYLVYNGFRANFNEELNQAIGELSSEGIIDLVLDLRYNGGGSVQTSAYLASMITGQFNGQDFTKLTYNQKASNNNSTYPFQNEGKIFDDQLEESGSFTLHHLNLNQVYVLTTRGTASASEMLISCLQPYINVETIGAKTYGKTVGSITLYDSPNSYYTTHDHINPNHTWALQPIVFEYKNSQNQSSPTQGINPNYELNELNYLENLPELGDPNEPLLSKAISLITGIEKNQVQPNVNQFSLFKNSQNLERFGTELYLDKGVEFNP